MSFNDNFNRASLGANWVVIPSSGSAGLTIVSNKVRSNESSAAGSWEYLTGTGITFANDQADSITLTVNTSGDDSYGGLLVRASTSAHTAYYSFGHISGGYELAKVVAGSFTGLASDATNAANNDYLELSVTGTALALKKNGSAYLSQTDSGISTGVPGIAMGWNPGGANGNLEMDDFTAMVAEPTYEMIFPRMTQQAVDRGAFF